MWRHVIPSVRCWVIPKCRFSVAIKSGSDIDDFLHSINTSSVQNPGGSIAVLETAAEFNNWLNENPVKTIDQFVSAARMATDVKSIDQKKVFAKVNVIANDLLSKISGNLKTQDVTNLLRFVLQINKNSEVSARIQSLFIEKNISESDLNEVPFNTLVMIIRYSDSTVKQQIVKTVVGSLVSRIEKELVSPADLFTILAGEGYDNSKWFHNAIFFKKAEQLVTFMSTAEKCALLKHMAVHKQRNKQLLGTIINSICISNNVLSVSQIVSIMGSCSNLTYYPPKIARKISGDLEKNSNNLNQWDDVISIAGSLIRIRMGDQKSWDLLVRWAKENSNLAKPFQLSKFVSGLAIIGEPSGKPLAKALKPFLRREKAITPNTWLNIVFSLAYFQELDAVHADSVLNKSFVEQIIGSSMDVQDRLRKAMILLMISSAAKVDLKEKYNGPMVSRQTFQQYGIFFDSKTIRTARQSKYFKNREDCDDIFLKSLFKLAPEDTHCQLPNIEECGVFVDAYVMPDPDSGLLISKNQWGSRKPRPLFFYGWSHTKQRSDRDKPLDETSVSGQEQLGLRLIRALGFDPVVVFSTELDYCSNDIERLNLLRDKIHKIH